MKIITALKSGEGRVAEIQSQVLSNWRECFPECEIVDVGEDRLFEHCLAGLNAGEVAAWVNADILFRREEAKRLIDWMRTAHSPFLIVGQRLDLLQGGQMKLCGPSEMDYFFFMKESFEGLPPVIMGRHYCDCALLAHCLRRRRALVIDATNVITATHQGRDDAVVVGCREEDLGSEEAQANKRNNHLRDFGPHIADVPAEFKMAVDCEIGQSTSRFIVAKRRVPLLRRLGLWGLWDRVTRGGIGFLGVHEYRGKNGCRYFTRSKIEWWSPNSNVQMRFKQVVDAPRGIWTGFDFPCMWHALCIKKRASDEEENRWSLFLWDPPSLSHRDKFPPLRWVIDFVFRWFARRCDELVLNIHPGLLDEIGFRREELEKWGKNGKLQLRMQDAFDKLKVTEIMDGDEQRRYDFGVLSNWSVAKGGPLMANALLQMPERNCLWIGDPPNAGAQTIKRLKSITFAGRLPQERAFEELAKCRVLVVPYLPVRSLKWNYVLKVFEYLKLGRPILASDNPGNVAVAQKYPGRIILFKSGSVEDFVRKARAVL